MTTTAKDVANTLGISTSTVGRALADDPRISAATKARVRAAAARLGYVGSTPARVMRGGSSNLVGLVLPDLQNDFYATIAQALSRCCDTEGYHLALSITDDDRDNEARHVKALISVRVAGMVIVPTASPRKDTAAMLDGVPHVQLLRHVDALNADWFGINDEECLFEGTQHLLALGHRRIAYIGGSTNLPTGAARLRGFHTALAAAGVGVNEAIELLGPTTLEFGAASAKTLLSALPPPTAVITAAVQITTGLMDALGTETDLVPGRLSVVGFGDPPSSKWWHGGMTALRMPVQKLATSCGLWFLHKLRTEVAPADPHIAICPAALVVRATTAAPRIGQP